MYFFKKLWPEAFYRNELLPPFALVLFLYLCFLVFGEAQLSDQNQIFFWVTGFTLLVILIMLYHFLSPTAEYSMECKDKTVKILLYCTDSGELRDPANCSAHLRVLILDKNGSCTEILKPRFIHGFDPSLLSINYFLIKENHSFWSYIDTTKEYDIYLGQRICNYIFKDNTSTKNVGTLRFLQGTDWIDIDNVIVENNPKLVMPLPCNMILYLPQQDVDVHHLTEKFGNKATTQKLKDTDNLLLIHYDNYSMDILKIVPNCVDSYPGVYKCFPDYVYLQESFRIVKYKTVNANLESHLQKEK